MVREFLFPSLTKTLILRVIAVIISCYIIFGHLLIPLRIQGKSMEPTYPNGSFAFSWRLQYLFSEPQRFDVVTVRYAGRRVMLLKRVIALPGETVEFRQGKLFINEQRMREPDIEIHPEWNVPPRTIRPGHLYVVGDNRSEPPEKQRFGEVERLRIVGKVFP